MSDLLGKFNVLVRSSISSVFGDDPRRRRGALPDVEHLGEDIDQEITALRERINRALDDEDEQTQAIDALRREVADWDQQADRALERGDEVAARHAIRQMQLTGQRQAMAESDLDQHRRATSELIQRVNELEALVAEARAQHAPAPVEPAAKASPVEVLSSRLRKARLFLETQELEALEPDAPPEDVEDGAIDDDLAQRRARLSQ